MKIESSEIAKVMAVIIILSVVFPSMAVTFISGLLIALAFLLIISNGKDESS